MSTDSTVLPVDDLSLTVIPLKSIHVWIVGGKRPDSSQNTSKRTVWNSSLSAESIIRGHVFLVTGEYRQVSLPLPADLHSLMPQVFVQRASGDRELLTDLCGG